MVIFLLMSLPHHAVGNHADWDLPPSWGSRGSLAAAWAANSELLIEQHAVSHILGKNVDQHTLSFALPPADYLDLARRIGQAREAYVDAVAGTEIGLFALTGMLTQAIYRFTLGVENFMLALYDEPEFVGFLCDYPLDVLYLAADVALRNGLMINPEHFKRMWIPRMKSVMEPAEQKGMFVILRSDCTLYDLIVKGRPEQAVRLGAFLRFIADWAPKLQP
jgi:hypothetical protein